MTHWMDRVRVIPQGCLGDYPEVYVDKVYAPWYRTTGHFFAVGRLNGLVDTLINSGLNPNFKY